MIDTLLESLRCLNTMLVLACITMLTNRYFPPGWGE